MSGFFGAARKQTVGHNAFSKCFGKEEDAAKISSQTVHPIQKELPLKASTVSPKKLCLVSARMHELQMSPVFMRVFLVYTGLESFCSILSCAIRDSSLPGYEYIAATAA